MARTYQNNLKKQNTLTTAAIKYLQVLHFLKVNFKACTCVLFRFAIIINGHNAGLAEGQVSLNTSHLR